MPLTEDAAKLCEMLGTGPDAPDDEVNKAYSAMMAGWYTSSDDRTKQELLELTKVYHRVTFHRYIAKHPNWFQEKATKPLIGKTKKDESGKFSGGIYSPWRRLFARIVDISTLSNKPNLRRAGIFVGVGLSLLIAFLLLRYENDQVGFRLIRYDRLTSRVEWKHVARSSDDWRPTNFKSLAHAKAAWQRQAMEDAAEAAQRETRSQMEDAHEETRSQMSEMESQLRKQRMEMEMLPR
jgi:hypothetical protein